MSSDLTVETFDAFVAAGDRPILVDFWAPWCGPCRQMEPVLNQLEAAGDVAVAKVNVDLHPTLAARFAVRSIPTMLLIDNGAVTARVVGALPLVALREAIGMPPSAPV